MSFYKVNANYRKILFLLAILGFSFIKFSLISNIPIVALPERVHDDRLMLETASNILKGEWLGNYSQMTLAKGPAFPIFLVFCKLLGITYVQGSLLFYIAGSCLFIYVMSRDVKNKLLLLIIYIFLLFNPLTYSLQTLQKIYRNGLILGQILFLVSGLYMLVKTRNDALHIKIYWAVYTGVILSFIWLTREDSVWVLPITIFILAYIAFQTIRNIKSAKRTTVFNFIVLFIPFFVLILSNTIISTINYKYYGIFTVNELNGSNFKKAIRSMNSVKDSQPNLSHITVSRNKMRMMYEISPTLNSISDYIDNRLDGWDFCDSNKGDGEVEDGWFFWAFRDAIYDAGYYENAQKANECYLKISNEIEDAIKNGLVEKQNVMPSALMSPWRNGYGIELIKCFKNALTYIVTYTGVGPDIVSSDGEIQEIRKFELITGNLAVYEYNNDSRFSGWIFRTDDSDYTVAITDKDGVQLRPIELNDSPDVYSYFISTDNQTYEKARRCRFDFLLDEGDKKDKYLSIINSQGQCENQISLSSGNITNNPSSDVYYYFDRGIIQNSDNVVFQGWSNVLGKITKIYAVTGPAFFILGLISYLILTIKLILDVRKRIWNNVDIWILLSGILGSMVCLILGVAYTHISAYDAIAYPYLAGAYSLMIAFWTVSGGYLIDSMLKTIKNRKRCTKVE